MPSLRRVIEEQQERYAAAGLTGPEARRAIAQFAGKVGPMLLRGAILRPRLRSAAGTPFVGRDVKVRNPQFVSLGAEVVIEDGAEVQGLSSEGVTFGDRVSIGAFAMVRPSSYYSHSLGAGLRVGDRSSIGPYCYIGCSGFISIGQDVMLAPGVRLFAEDHLFDDATETIKSQWVDRAPILIEDDCWIASGATITSGVRVGHGSVVAAGSVVTRDVPPMSVVAGVPARVIRSRQRG